MFKIHNIYLNCAPYSVTGSCPPSGTSILIEAILDSQLANSLIQLSGRAPREVGHEMQSIHKTFDNSAQTQAGC